MSDGAAAVYRPFEEGYAPQSRVDQAILATRQAVFPELGIDPGL
jgi:acetoin utilization protein AcuC